MKRIIVGIDGSEQSWVALDRAAELAKSTSAGLQLVHVTPEALLMPIGDATLAPAATEWAEAQEQYAKGLLREASARVKSKALEVDAVVRTGAPAEALADLANKADVTMIVVGHRGRNLAARLLVGSVADRLVQISPRPVLVVR